MTDDKVVTSALREMLRSGQVNMEQDSQEEIESFLLERADSEGEGAGAEEAAAAPPAIKKQRLAGGGAAAAGGPPGADFYVQLAPRRFVTLSTFKGKHYEGKLSPGAKGLSMAPELWAALVAGAAQLTQGLEASDCSVVVQLGGTRRAAVSSYGGRTRVDLREMYEKGGELLPGKKGISLAPEQWAKLTTSIDEITAALEAKTGAPLPAATKPAAPAAPSAKPAADAAPADEADHAAGAAGGGVQQGVLELGGKKRAVADLFKGKPFLSLREYYEKGGELLPGKKGISLTPEQFATLRQAAPQLSTALQAKDTSVEVPLSASRRASVREFKGKHFVDLREFYKKAGEAGAMSRRG
eukprot:scaffold15.g4356.t1